jgi:hypothetical protein
MHFLNEKMSHGTENGKKCHLLLNDLVKGKNLTIKVDEIRPFSVVFCLDL